MNFLGIEDLDFLSSFTPYDHPERLHAFHCPAILHEVIEEDYGAEWHFKVLAGPEKGRKFLGYTDEDSEETQTWAESLAGRILSRPAKPKDVEGKKTIIQIQDDPSGISRAKVLAYPMARLHLKTALDVERGLKEIEDFEFHHRRNTR